MIEEGHSKLVTHSFTDRPSIPVIKRPTRAEARERRERVFVIIVMRNLAQTTNVRHKKLFWVEGLMSDEIDDNNMELQQPEE